MIIASSHWVEKRTLVPKLSTVATHLSPPRGAYLLRMKPSIHDQEILLTSRVLFPRIRRDR